MNGWKKRWNDELKSRTPDLSDEVKNAPIATPQAAMKKPRFSLSSWIAAHKRQFYSLCGACAAVVITVCAAIPAMLKKDEPVTLVGVQINPAVVLSVDEDGVVVSAVAANADADVMLADKARVKNIVGKRVEDATVAVVDLAARLGYLDLNERGGAVRLTSPDEKYDLGGALARVKEYCMQQGSYTVVLSETLSLQEFCEDFHLQVQKTVQTLAESVAKMNVLYGYRQVGESDFGSGNDFGGENAASDYYAQAAKDGIESFLHGAVDEYFDLISEQLGETDTGLLYQILATLSNGEVLALLADLGVDTAVFEELVAVPQTLKEYKEKLALRYQENYAARLQKYAESYNQVRDELSQNAYDYYVAFIAGLNGTLADYWDFLQSLQ